MSSANGRNHPPVKITIQIGTKRYASWDESELSDLLSDEPTRRLAVTRAIFGAYWNAIDQRNLSAPYPTKGQRP